MTKISAMSGGIYIKPKGIITITHLGRKYRWHPHSVGLRKTQREKKNLKVSKMRLIFGKLTVKIK